MENANAAIIVTARLTLPRMHFGPPLSLKRGKCLVCLRSNFPPVSVVLGHIGMTRVQSIVPGETIFDDGDGNDLSLRESKK